MCLILYRFKNFIHKIFNSRVNMRNSVTVITSMRVNTIASKHNSVFLIKLKFGMHIIGQSQTNPTNFDECKIYRFCTVLQKKFS